LTFDDQKLKEKKYSRKLLSFFDEKFQFIFQAQEKHFKENKRTSSTSKMKYLGHYCFPDTDPGPDPQH
jgi:hypothetical protein